MNSLSTNAAASLEERTCNPASVVGGDEGDDVGDVIRLASAAERGVSHGVLLKISANDASRFRSFGDGKAGVYSVDTNLLWSEFLGKDTGDSVDCTLGTGVDRRVRRREL